MTVAVTPEEFYKANIGMEKEYVRVYVAHEVKRGEEISMGFSRITVPEDGYQVNKNVGFLSREQFAALAVSVEGQELPLPKEDLDEEALQNIRPVKIGDNVTMNMGGGTSANMLVDRDGFVITKQNGQIFMSNFELMSQFNYAGRKHETKKELIVTLNDQEPIRGIILDEDAVFDFAGCTQSVPAGSLLMIDPEEEDGYLLQRPFEHLNTQLRVSADWTARQQLVQIQHEDAVEKQAKLNARAPRVRLRKTS